MNKTMYVCLMVAMLMLSTTPTKAINKEWSAVAGFVGGLLVANAVQNYERDCTPVVYREHIPVVYRETVNQVYYPQANNLPGYHHINVNQNDTPRFNLGCR